MTTAIVSFLLLVLLADLFLLLIWRGCTTPQSQWLGPILVRGQMPGRRTVALTFDDGPAPPFTEQILAILRQYRVPATFFVCGKNVELFPETLQQIHAEGHLIGNHTYSHPYLILLNRARMEEEIDQTQQAIQGVLGFRPVLFRPPYGVRWLGLHVALRERGMQAVAWSALGYDWINPAEEIVNATVKDLAPGSIILLHDGRQPWVQPRKVVLWRVMEKLGFEPKREPLLLPPVDSPETVKALPAIIEKVREAGVEFVPLSEFLSPAASNQGISVSRH